MPSYPELKSMMRVDLAHAIIRHGGFASVAKKIGLKRPGAQKPRNYWGDFANVERELLAFISKHGMDGVMPTDAELNATGYSSLALGIRQHGGFEYLAKRLGLQRPNAHVSKDYWNDFENVTKELMAFIAEYGTEGLMPTSKQLSTKGRSDLRYAIGKHGGFPTVAQRLELEQPEAQRPPGYWDDFKNLKQELLRFITEFGREGTMPNKNELIAAGQSSLLYAIGKHGGYQTVAERLGLQLNRFTLGYWNDFETLKQELLKFIAESGKDGIMPTKAQMDRAGRSSLYYAIGKHGGLAFVTEQLGLKLTNTSKPRGYWEDFANVEKELLQFIDEYGISGVMPKQLELKSADRIDLAGAISEHGGFAAVAKKLGLAFVGKEHINSRTASSIEHTACAIQPLAESNLLSGAQVMIILRRAGLLEYRNQRILRLNAGLARGNHDEIESAIATLVSGGEEISTETITVTETDDLTAAEAEALASAGLDAGKVPLAESLLVPNTPDTTREQAVIHGLSALGQLRLPLDKVLTLLTSKVLWQAFYRRLYTWYGSLDAAQSVTFEDVQAAVLNAYPEHAENEFVAEASAIFASEIEQAINFAASLADFGWSGPRLRLHQAQAARLMADVLVGAHGDASLQSPFLLNADDPGMGKSASFLAAVCAADIQSVVLVAPKTVADDTWTSRNGEIRRCLPRAKIVRGLDNTLTTEPQSGLTFFVLHYEELLNEDACAKLAERSFDCLCLDEIHFIKQRAAQTEPTHRRSAMEMLRASAQTAIGLTGTPLVNELAEPMSLLQTLSQHAPQFDHSKLSNRRMSDIADVFESILPHIIRRRKDETLLHLPGCDVRPVAIPLPPDLDEQMHELYKLPRHQASHALVELRKLATIAKLPHLVGRAENAQKLLVLTYLTDDISEKIAAYLEEFLPNQVGHINGQTPRAERQKRIESFRNSNGIRVLVGTVGTIGTGLTLFDPKSAETTNEIIFADLPYTFAEFDQGVARLYREGQKQRVHVDVLQTTTTATLRDGSPLSTLDERIWDLIEGKRELADIAIDGKYDTTDAASKVQKALRRWLKQAREIGVELLSVERRATEQTSAQRWRGEIARLRGASAAKADEIFADPNYTREFLEHLKTSVAAQLAHQWLRGKLSLLIRPGLSVVDMGCGLNPFADLPCQVIGLDRHDLPGQLRGKMEHPPLPDKSADVLIYSLSLYGTAVDLFAYFTHAARILRGGGHLFIVEPDSAFSEQGLARFIGGLRQFGLELVGTVKELRGEDGVVLKGMHLTLTGELGKPETEAFERK